MTDTLTPLLLDAKKEYTMRLSEIMSPFVLQFIDSTYKSAKKDAGNRKALMEFQHRLRQVPSWNAGIITQFTREIESKYGYFSDLVAAVFVTYVKVLSSIKISSQRPNVKLKLPTNEAFVHQVYVYSSKNFYENPYSVKESQQTKACMVLNAIEAAVRNMLPLGDVLSAYLSSAVNDDNTMNPILSPAQSVDGNAEEREDHMDHAQQEAQPSSDSESDFDEGEERIVHGISGPVDANDVHETVSPINQPFPYPPISQTPVLPTATMPVLAPPQQPPQPVTLYPQQQQQPQQPQQHLFPDAVDRGEQQFR